MPRYLLHIGPHKTGTTYIQTRLDAARDLLRAAGVIYPATWRAAELVPSHLRLFQRLRNRQLDELRRELADLAAGPDEHVVLSSEDLQFLEPAEVQILRDELSPHNVTVVYYCRRWSELIPSCWQELVKHGDHVPLQEFLLGLIATPHQSPITNYGLVLDRYLAVFGAERLRVVSYSAVMDAGLDLAEHFVASFLPPLAGALPPAVDSRPNASLSPEDTEVIRVLNGLHHRRTGNHGPAIRTWYLQQAETPDLSLLRHAVTAAMVKAPFSDAMPMLESLHRHVFARFRSMLVPPVAGDRLFRPLPAEVTFARGDYLADPVVAVQVRVLYQRWRDGVG